MANWRALIVLGLGLTAAACTLTPVPPGERAALLREHDTLLRPEGPGPFPAVVLMHSCAGNLGHVDRWARELRDAGYVALVVNSMRARNLENTGGRLMTCRGGTLRAPDRAVDALIGLERLRRRDDVDADRLAVIGFSHGGWAALALLGDAFDDAPLRAAAPGGTAGVRAIAAVYPFCGKDTLAGGARWPRNVEVLLLLAARDRTVGLEPCRGFARRQQARGLPVRHHIYAEAEHAFDVHPDLILGFERRWRPDDAADARARILALLARVFRS